MTNILFAHKFSACR